VRARLLTKSIFHPPSSVDLPSPSRYSYSTAAVVSRWDPTRWWSIIVVLLVKATLVSSQFLIQTLSFSLGRPAHMAISMFYENCSWSPSTAAYACITNLTRRIGSKRIYRCEPISSCFLKTTWGAWSAPAISHESHILAFAYRCLFLGISATRS